MYSFESSRALINKTISNLRFNYEPEELYEPIHYILSLGGKRLRPSLVIMACNLFSDNVEDAIYPAIGIEVFHNFTLLHDDIMDKAPVRRNNPTVHTKWNENIAILSGDVMSILAYEYLCKCPPAVLSDIIRIFTQTALHVCEGQQFDMNFEKIQNISMDEYLKMIELKTSVLIASCLKIGSIIGRATSKDADLMYDFGKNLGLAFQLQDDILDVYGDPKIFGKKTGGDIVANKKTFLLIKAFELADGVLLRNLQQQCDERHYNAKEKIKAVKDIYNKLGVKDQADDMVRSFYQKAFQSFNNVSVESSKKTELENLAEGLIKREN
jgi:geranylgeranyl diphosphate synthase type II